MLASLLARNSGIDMWHSGDYIGFVDGDDTVDEDMFGALNPIML